MAEQSNGNFFALLNVGLAEHHSDWNWRNVRSPFTRVYLVTHGTGVVEMNGQSYRLTPGMLFMIPAYVVHNDICMGDFTHYYMHIYNLYTGLPPMAEQLELPVAVRAPEMAEQMFARLVCLFEDLVLPASDPRCYDNHQTLVKNLKLYMDSPVGHQVESRGIICFLLASFLRNAPMKVYAKDLRMIKAVDYIRRHIAGNVSVDEIARGVCMSKSHFIRVFRHKMGETPIHYLNKLRIEEAECRLLTGSASVKEIAYELGFHDYNYFFKVFKKFTGRTPQCYRGQLLG